MRLETSNNDGSGVERVDGYAPLELVYYNNDTDNVFDDTYFLTW